MSNVFYLRRSYLKRLRDDQVKHLYEMMVKQDAYLSHEDADAPSKRLRRLRDEMERRKLL